jgi:hypothetical protein
MSKGFKKEAKAPVQPAKKPVENAAKAPAEAP